MPWQQLLCMSVQTGYAGAADTPSRLCSGEAPSQLTEGVASASLNGKFLFFNIPIVSEVFFLVCTLSGVQHTAVVVVAG